MFMTVKSYCFQKGFKKIALETKHSQLGYLSLAIKLYQFFSMFK